MNNLATEVKSPALIEFQEKFINEVNELRHVKNIIQTQVKNISNCVGPENGSDPQPSIQPESFLEHVEISFSILRETRQDLENIVSQLNQIIG